MSGRRTGVWIVGINGGLATTLIAGARMVARGLAPSVGMITEKPEFDHLEPTPLEGLVFGGHDVRATSVYESALEIHRENGTIPFEPLQAIRDDLDAVNADVRSGTVVNCGKAVAKLASTRVRRDRRDLKTVVAALKSDMVEFRDRHDLDDVIVLNLASTEPPLRLDRDHRSLAGMRRILAGDDSSRVRGSTLYAWAAIDAGFPFLNFTPSNACITEAHVKLACKVGVPVMGNDGKTGETLVKSVLAPMFRYRDLRVRTWQGYNILGDRDGAVLSDEDNKASKISTKDGILASILGYPLHTHVSIDFAESLADMKTAWDFIHFEGFLAHKMSLQFTWQGCDAILAAPIALDMVRLTEYAHRVGDSGLMPHLACFLKNPIGVDVHDLHAQYLMLAEYVAERI